MGKVYFSPVTEKNSVSNAAQVLFSDPVPLYEDLLESRSGSDYLKCPAFIEYCKNTYIVKAAFDMEFNHQEDFNLIQSSLLSQEFFDDYVNFKADNVNEFNLARLTMPPRYIFWADNETKIEALPPFLQAYKTPSNVNFVPATFDISRWIRPVEYTVMILNLKKSVKIRKGDALFFIRLIPRDGSKIMLERVEYTDRINNMIKSCVCVKFITQNKSLNNLYEMAKSVVSIFKANNKYNKH
jgi:hypothetical protein